MIRRTHQRHSPIQIDGISVADLADLVDGLSNATTPGVVRSPGEALALPAYWRGVSLVAGTIAGLPVHAHRTMRDGSKRQVPTLFRDPSPLMTHVDYWSLVMVDLMVHGNHFAEVIRSGNGQPEGLVPITPTRVSVMLDGLEKVYRVEPRPGEPGEPQEMTADEVWHPMGISLDGLVGLSSIALHRRPLELGGSAEAAGRALFDRGMLLSGVLSPKENLTPEQAEMVRREWDARAMGVRNANSTVVAPVNMEWVPLSSSNEDSQWLGARAFAVEDIARITGVPPHLLMQTEKQTSWGTGVAEQNEGLARYTLRPWTDRLEAAMDRLEPVDHEFQYGALLRPSTQARYEAYRTAIEGGWMTVNEVRDLEDMSPLPQPSSDLAPFGATNSEV